MKSNTFDIIVANGEIPTGHDWELLLKNDSGETIWVGDRDGDLAVMDGPAYCRGESLLDAIDCWGPINSDEIQDADLAVAMGLGGRVSLNNGFTWMAPENCTESEANEILEQIWNAATSPGNGRLNSIVENNNLDYFDSPVDCLAAIMRELGWDFTF